MNFAIDGIAVLCDAYGHTKASLSSPRKVNKEREVFKLCRLIIRNTRGVARDGTYVPRLGNSKKMIVVAFIIA